MAEYVFEDFMLQAQVLTNSLIRMYRTKGGTGARLCRLKQYIVHSMHHISEGSLPDTHFVLLSSTSSSAGVYNTEDNVRDWHEVLYMASGLGQYVSACIML